jgi:cysteinyl-tRNA synthetase
VGKMKIYNTMSRKKEQFKPMNDQRVKLFVCGPTVYDDAHIGHGRTYISFDMIKRYLEYKGYSVFYLQNVTDIDDKIINRSAEVDADPEVLARKFEKRYQEDMDALGVNGVNFFARATDHVPEIISQIETLIKKGFAYETPTGVYFDEAKFENFGKLSRRNLEDLNVHRVNIDSTKKNPGDFALWKKRDVSPVWDSPWGTGRPGWHIEDTAITEEYFGPQYDIHGGGLDLIFPHHEAEIAQMEAASGKAPMVRYWMHTGFLNVSGEKMSKSLGNFITIRDLLEDHDPQVFRFFVLSTHYRSPIDFSEKTLEQAAKSLKRIQKTVEKLNELLDNSSGNDDAYFSGLLEEYQTKFLESMDNDFNTPEALAHIFNFVKELNKAFEDKTPSEKVLKDIISFFEAFGEIMGFDLAVKSNDGDISGELLDIIKDVRQKLREKKEWALSDDIRGRLNDLGIDVED